MSNNTESTAGRRGNRSEVQVLARTITTPDGTQWFVSVDYDGKAKLVITRSGGPSERYDFDQNDRVALVRALSGAGD